MKKLLPILLVLLLVLAAAAAETLPADCVYRVFQSADGREVVATAFVSAGGELVCPRSALSGAQSLRVEDLRGQPLAVTETLQLGETCLQLKVDGTLSAPLPQAADESQSLIAVTATRSGIALAQAQRTAQLAGHTDGRFMVFCAEKLLPGAILLNADNAVTGFILGTWTERTDAYIALPVDALRGLEAKPVQQTAAKTSWSEDFTIRQEKNLATVVLNDEMKSISEDIVVLCAREGNTYYDYVVIKSSDDRSEVPFLLIPGESYRFGVWITGDGSLPQGVFSAPLRSLTYPAVDGLFTKHDYTEKRVFIGLMPDRSTLNTGAQATPVDLTRAVLEANADALVVQVDSAYRIEGSDQCDLLAVLRTPEDYTFTEPGTFLFDASMQAEDDWHIDLAAMFANYLQMGSGYAAGSYSICWYFEDLLVGGIVFILD